MTSMTTTLILQNSSYVAQIISSISIIFIVWQTIISLKDIRTKSKREAGLLSMQQAEKFANEILPEVSKIKKLFAAEEVILEKKKIFVYSELKNELVKNKNLQHLFEVTIEKPELLAHTQSLLNKIEAMSMVFVSGIGDESIVFSSLAKPFCGVVEEYYFVIAMARKDEDHNKRYEHVVELYKIWVGRAEKNKLTADIEKLNYDVKNIQDRKVEVIGA